MAMNNMNILSEKESTSALAPSNSTPESLRHICHQSSRGLILSTVQPPLVKVLPSTIEEIRLM